MPHTADVDTDVTDDTDTNDDDVFAACSAAARDDCGKLFAPPYGSSDVCTATDCDDTMRAGDNASRRDARLTLVMTMLAGGRCTALLSSVTIALSIARRAGDRGSDSSDATYDVDSCTARPTD